MVGFAILFLATILFIVLITHFLNIVIDALSNINIFEVFLRGVELVSGVLVFILVLPILFIWKIGEIRHRAEKL